jgi:tRNA pseudouridine38-40 synthase
MARAGRRASLKTENRQPSMERYQVILAYDGSHYKGFQRQANARSVQAVVENALRKVGWDGNSILAAGRTDTGVHAIGQVIAFELDWGHEPEDLQTALNALLPFDVVAREVRQVCPSFHPRYDASWRKYFYRLYCQPVRQPLLEPYAWRVWPAVELGCLCEAARPLVGTHDFGAFGSSPQKRGSTTRFVLQADWVQESPYLVFEITAQAFLYHMVRRIVYMQVMIAQEKLTINDLQQALDSGADVRFQVGKIQNPANRLVHGLAPAQGLILAEVSYPPESLEVAEDKKLIS